MMMMMMIVVVVVVMMMMRMMMRMRMRMKMTTKAVCARARAKPACPASGRPHARPSPPARAATCLRARKAPPRQRGLLSPPGTGGNGEFEPPIGSYCAFNELAAVWQHTTAPESRARK